MDKDYEILPDPLETDEEALSGLLRQYYIKAGGVPAEYIAYHLSIPDSECGRASFWQMPPEER